MLLIWKIISVILLLNYIFGFVFGSFSQNANLIEIAIIIIEGIALVGVFSYAFRRKLLEAKYWKYIFWVYLVAVILTFTLPHRNGNLYLGVPTEDLTSIINILGLIGVITITGFFKLYPMYQLAFISSTSQQKKTKKPKK